MYEYIYRYDEAIAAYQQAIDIQRTNGPSASEYFVEHVGQLLEDQGRYDELIALYRQAAAVNDTFYLRLGGVFQRLARYADAAAMFITAIHECAHPGDVYEMLVSGESSSRYEGALRTVEIMQETPGTNSHTTYALGFIYQGMGRYPDSIDAFRCFLRAQRHRTDIHVEIGIDYYHLQRYAEAIAELMQGITKSARDARALYYLSLSAWKSGEYEQARGYFRKLQARDREMAARLKHESEGFFER